MKVLVALLSLAAFTWAQEEPTCMCGAFISTLHGEYEVHRLPRIPVDDCETEKKCAAPCAQEWNIFTDFGNLDYVMGNGVTVGQEFCRAMADHGRPNLAPHDVYLYYNLCFGPWMYDGQTSQQQLCCEEGVYPGNCGVEN